MVQPGDGAGLGEVSLGVFRPGDAIRMGNLDGDRPPELLVVGKVDEAETALAQDFLDTVAADGRGQRIGGDCGRRFSGPRLEISRLVDFVHRAYRDSCSSGSFTKFFKSFYCPGRCVARRAKPDNQNKLSSVWRLFPWPSRWPRRAGRTYRPLHCQDAGPDRFGQRRPYRHQLGQVRVAGNGFGIQCAVFCATLNRTGRNLLGNR